MNAATGDRLAPVALFAFNRPAHLSATLDALAANPGAEATTLYAFCDGPRGPADEAGVAAVRRLVREERRFGAVEIVERDENEGLAGSLSAGITRVCREHGRVIVVEDDILCSPLFLGFMNTALDRFEEVERVMHVSAYMFPVEDPQGLPEVFLYRGASCWGWGTWERAWRSYREDAGALLREIRERRLERYFNVNGTTDYVGMLRAQARGEIDSWAVRWYASIVLRGGLCLHPARSFASNIGHDGSGVHCDTSNAYDVSLADGPVADWDLRLQEDPVAVAKMERFYRGLRRPLLARVAGRLSRALRGAGAGG